MFSQRFYLIEIGDLACKTSGISLLRKFIYSPCLFNYYSLNLTYNRMRTFPLLMGHLFNQCFNMSFLNRPLLWLANDFRLMASSLYAFLMASFGLI